MDPVKAPEDMTDRELLIELVRGKREMEAALENLAQSPMIGAMMGGGNPLLAMMGKG